MTTHTYATTLRWSGDTSDYLGYSRNHTMTVGPKEFEFTSDPAFHGDPALANPEQLLVAAASSCQMLSFLGACGRSGVTALEYTDDTTAIMPEDDHPVRITQIHLRPHIVVRRIKGSDEATIARVERLIEKAHEACFIANSIRSEIIIEPQIEVAPEAD